MLILKQVKSRRVSGRFVINQYTVCIVGKRGNDPVNQYDRDAFFHYRLKMSPIPAHGHIYNSVDHFTEKKLHYLAFNSFVGMAITDNNAVALDRKSTRLNSSHSGQSRMPSSA